MPIEYYLVIAVCWSIGAIVTGFAGFGAALIAMPIIAMFVPMKIAVPCGTMIAFLMKIHLIRSYWAHIDWRRVAPMICAAPFGALTGVTFAKSVDGGYLQLGLGMLLLSFSLWSLFFDRKKERPPIHKNWGILAGFSSAAIGSSIGMGGPPTIVFTALSGWNQAKIKAGIAGFFFAAGAIMISFQTYAGIQTMDTLITGLICTPLVFLGTRLGMKLSERLAERSYRKNLFRMLLIFALIILYKASTKLGFIAF